MKYYNLAGCEPIALLEGEQNERPEGRNYRHVRSAGRMYECGTEGGNILFSDGQVWENTGNGSMNFCGAATPEALGEFDEEYHGSGSVEWDGSNYRLIDSSLHDKP